MRSWTPRRPSSAVEERLFGREVEPAPRRHASRERLAGWGWLAPVACVFVLVLQLATPDGHERPLAGGQSTTTLGDGSSNSLLLAYAFLENELFEDVNVNAWRARTLQADAHDWANSAMNNVNGETFKSTNWTTAPSSMRNLPVFLTLTNGLIQ
ncbi:hypothetical protein GC207_02765 [bacterium]|nr:hypothetical protein [bacterium]